MHTRRAFDRCETTYNTLKACQKAILEVKLKGYNNNNESIASANEFAI